MATARIIHFGKDDCHRVSVLRSAGYAVEDCRSLRAFREALTGGGTPDALFITESESNLEGDAISLARSCSPAPLVLFRRSHGDLSPGTFDLVIDSLTPPKHWLQEIGELIARGRTANRTVRAPQSESRSSSSACEA